MRHPHRKSQRPLFTFTYFHKSEIRLLTGKRLVFGITYHGSTARPLAGLDNLYGKHISAARLQRHLEWITARFKVLPIQEILQRSREGRLSSGTVFIAFHDGYVGNYQVAFPLLLRLGIRADFCVTTSYVGSDHRFWVDVLDAALKYTRTPTIRLDDAQEGESLPLNSEEERLAAAIKLRKFLKTKPRSDFDLHFQRILHDFGWENPSLVPRLGDHEACMDWRQIREMSDAGMSIGSHTHRHTICVPQEDAVVREEMCLSKTAIERETGVPCSVFCYPNGNYPRDGDERTDRIAKECGYETVLYMMSACNFVHPGTFRLTGLAFGEETEVDDIRRSLSRIRIWKRKLSGRPLTPWISDGVADVAEVP
jgi:peptidoglycan/xylan/chitin deacetylase (PgdA/CDA1 family)